MEAESFEFEAPEPKRRSRGLLVFVIGVALGVAVTVLWPRWVSPYLPDALRSSRETVEGPVLGKTSEQDRLLLTVQAEQGAILVTFTRRVAEIDLLVDRGDTVSLGIERYEPFVENPEVKGVRKATSRVEHPARPSSAATQDADGDSVGTPETGREGEGEAVDDSEPSSNRETGAPTGQREGPGGG